jgi:hypothetical protein
VSEQKRPIHCVPSKKLFEVGFIKFNTSVTKPLYILNSREDIHCGSASQQASETFKSSFFSSSRLA